MSEWTEKHEHQSNPVQDNPDHHGHNEETTAGMTDTERQAQGHAGHGMHTHSGKPLEECTIRELRALATEKKIKGRARMKKEELIHVLRSGNREPEPASVGSSS